jgi:predicted dehydrogenase
LTESIPVIVVGSGHGCRVHVPALRAAGFNLVALVGNDEQRTQRRAQRLSIPLAATDLTQAIDQTNAQAVTIASTPHTHYPLAKIALSKGCHVMTEKPFTLQAEHAKELLLLAQEKGVQHLLGNQMRARPERVAVANAIAQGAIGQAKFITLVQYASLLADTRQAWPQWWFDAEQGGGWLGASGSHMIDQVRSWLGEFESLSASLPTVAARENVTEDSFAVRFRLRNGVEGIMQQCGAAWGEFSAMTRVSGTDGSLWIDNGKAWLADINGTRELEPPANVSLPAMPVSDDPREQFLHLELPPAQRLFENWRNSILQQPQTNPTQFANFNDGLAAMQVLEAIRLSAANDGATVPVDANSVE